MKRKNILLVALLSVTLILTSCGKSMESKRTSNETSDGRLQVTELKESTHQSSVLIPIGETKDDFGTGVVVGKNTVVTAKHVVKPEESKNFSTVSVWYGATTEEGQEQFVKFPVMSVTYADDGIDIAVVEVGKSDDGKSIGDVAQLAKLSNGREINKEDSVSIAGYPGDKTFGSLWISEGKVLDKEETLLTLDAKTSGGNSGSPLYNSNGEVIGVVNSAMDHKTYATIFGDTLAFVEGHIK